MLIYFPEEKVVKRKKLPPENQIRKTLYTVSWKDVFRLGRFELSVFLLIIIFIIANLLYFTHDFFAYLAITMNPLSIYAYARFPILLSYYLNDRHNEFEIDFDEQKMYFKSGRVVQFSEIAEIEMHVGGLFPDLMPSFYQPFGRYKYLGFILKSGEMFIITRILMEKFIHFPVMEFTFFRDTYPFIHPTKI
ncbi:MAG: hypothetical protein WCH34_13150 [Bacteroidota bacterium]